MVKRGGQQTSGSINPLIQGTECIRPKSGKGVILLWNGKSRLAPIDRKRRGTARDTDISSTAGVGGRRWEILTRQPYLLRPLSGHPEGRVPVD